MLFSFNNLNNYRTVKLGNNKLMLVTNIPIAEFFKHLENLNAEVTCNSLRSVSPKVKLTKTSTVSLKLCKHYLAFCFVMLKLSWIESMTFWLEAWPIIILCNCYFLLPQNWATTWNDVFFNFSFFLSCNKLSLCCSFCKKILMHQCIFQKIVI